MKHGGTGPEQSHHVEHFVEARSATLEGRTDRLIFLAQPATSDAEGEPSPGERLQRLNTTCNMHRVSKWENVNPRSDTNCRRHSEEMCGHQKHVGERSVGRVTGTPRLLI